MKHFTKLIILVSTFNSTIFTMFNNNQDDFVSKNMEYENFPPKIKTNVEKILFLHEAFENNNHQQQNVLVEEKKLLNQKIEIANKLLVGDEWIKGQLEEYDLQVTRANHFDQYWNPTQESVPVKETPKKTGFFVKATKLFSCCSCSKNRN